MDAVAKVINYHLQIVILTIRMVCKYKPLLHILTM